MHPFSIIRLLKSGWKVYRIRCEKGTYYWKIEEAKMKDKELTWTTDLNKLSSQQLAQINLDKLLELQPKSVQI